MLLVANKNLLSVLLAESLAPLLTKPRQPVFMGQNHRANFSGIHCVHHDQKLLAAAVHAPTNFLDKLHVGEAACRTKLFQGTPLVLQIGPLTLATDPAIGDRLTWTRRDRWLMSKGQNLVFGIIATACGRPTSRLESALAIPPLNRLAVHIEHVSDFMTSECAFSALHYTL